MPITLEDVDIEKILKKVVDSKIEMVIENSIDRKLEDQVDNMVEELITRVIPELKLTTEALIKDQAMKIAEDLIEDRFGITINED